MHVKWIIYGTAEWVTTSQDVLWRRSKLGLASRKKNPEALDAYLIVKTHSNEAAKIV